MEDDELLDLLERDLMALIQDDGLTASRLEAYAPNITQLFGFRPASDVENLIREALQEMPHNKYTWALSFALGIESVVEYSTRLTDRRNLLKKQDTFKVSEDTLRRWERRAMRTLARHIVAKARQLESPEQPEAHVEALSAEALLAYFDRIDTLEAAVKRLESQVERLDAAVSPKRANNNS